MNDFKPLNLLFIASLQKLLWQPYNTKYVIILFYYMSLFVGPRGVHLYSCQLSTLQKHPTASHPFYARLFRSLVSIYLWI